MRLVEEWVSVGGEVVVRQQWVVVLGKKNMNARHHYVRKYKTRLKYSNYHLNGSYIVGHSGTSYLCAALVGLDEGHRSLRLWRGG